MKQTLINTSDIQAFKEYLGRSVSLDSDLFHQYIDIFVHGTLDSQLKRYDFIVKDIAQRIGKEVRFSIDSVPVKMHLEPYKSLIQSLIHVFRNALDHGIEFPDERTAVGKSLYGTLTISIKLDSSGRTLHLVISDDGRGIDAQAVKNSAIKKGLYSEKELDDFSIEQNIVFYF